MLRPLNSGVRLMALDLSLQRSDPLLEGGTLFVYLLEFEQRAVPVLKTLLLGEQSR